MNEVQERATMKSLAEAVGAFERGYLVEALRAHGGRRLETAVALGVSRKTLWQKIRDHGISDDEFGGRQACPKCGAAPAGASS